VVPALKTQNTLAKPPGNSSREGSHRSESNGITAVLFITNQTDERGHREKAHESRYYLAQEIIEGVPDQLCAEAIFVHGGVFASEQRFDHRFQTSKPGPEGAEGVSRAGSLQ
jgi:hypothetical protein